jgi:hypothetical protein
MLKRIVPGLAVFLLIFEQTVIPAHAEGDWRHWFSLERAKEIAPMTDETYNEECGACHFAYQAGLLPAASWQKLLDATALQDHFGDNAELEESVRRHILEIVVSNAADNSYTKRSRKIMASLHGQAPLRITEVRYIHEKHEDIPARLIKGNPDVKSLSQCDRCHQKAKDGNFDDDTVMIPGHGYWTW